MSCDLVADKNKSEKQKVDSICSNDNDTRIVIINENKDLSKCSSCVQCNLFPCKCIPNIPSYNSQKYSDLASVYITAYNNNVCPINIPVFHSYLRNYDLSKFVEIMDIVQNGVQLHSDKVLDLNVEIPSNQKSTVEFHDLVDEMLMKELKEGRIAGPFLKPPPGLIISPLGAVPKKEKNKIRIIHNLSHPLKNSVNSHIPRHYCAVEYELIDVCCSLVFSLGKGCLMAKGDLCQAFRLLKVSLSDLRFLGFTWNDLFYFDKMMPMGAAISCAQFEKLSCAIQWILKQIFGVKDMSHILDDFLFFGKAGTRDCELGLKSFLLLSESLGLKVKPEKTVWPATQVEMHGILFDSVAMTLSLPPDKVEKALMLIDDIFKKRKVQLVKIQQFMDF